MIRPEHRSTAATPVVLPILLALAAAATLGAAAGQAGAAVKLPALLGDNCVLQRDAADVAIWGWADPDEEVTVSVAGQSAKAAAGKDGKWRVKLPALPAGGPHEMTVSGKNTVKVANVLVGEVWLCSGQSNMQWGLAGSTDGAKEIAEANYPQIRYFAVKFARADKPQEDCAGVWVVCSPQTARGFSGVAYFFGRQLHKDLKVPVGLIYNAVGATPIEPWMDRGVIEGDAEFKTAITRYEKMMADFKVYQEAMAKWSAEANQARAAGQDVPPEPKRTSWDATNTNPGILYNGMIAPLFPYRIAGVIWYQGESNGGQGKTYARLLPAMIANWRKGWGVGDLPFLIVQLPNYGKVDAEPGEGGWALVREAQLKALSLPKTGLAVTIDVGEANVLHPPRKREVGERLALAALGVAYDRKIVFSGPIFESAKADGDRMRLAFKHVGGALEAKGGAPLKGFAIAGADKKFVWASATIEGNEVVVSSDKVKAPVAVRYAWGSSPECNLFNKEGLPASPFRTDDW
jgi:sialate O-acetylesterase